MLAQKCGDLSFRILKSEAVAHAFLVHFLAASNTAQYLSTEEIAVGRRQIVSQQRTYSGWCTANKGWVDGTATAAVALMVELNHQRLIYGATTAPRVK